MSPLSTPASHFPAPDGAVPLLVLLDPAASRADGEAVRIARDVLRGGADVKVALPESPSELDRAISHRGRRRPVVVGSDLAVQRVLQVLHRQRELGTEPLGVVPVGGPGATGSLKALGVPCEPVAAARAVLGGNPRKLDLLVDDAGGVALSLVRITAGARTAGAGPWRSLWAKLAAPEQARPVTVGDLRIEADGHQLVGVHQQVRLLRVALADGVMELALRMDGRVQRHRAASLTVEGPGFAYQADGCPAGPVRTRTWKVHAGAWELILPAA